MLRKERRAQMEPTKKKGLEFFVRWEVLMLVCLVIVGMAWISLHIPSREMRVIVGKAIEGKNLNYYEMVGFSEMEVDKKRRYNKARRFFSRPPIPEPDIYTVFYVGGRACQPILPTFRTQPTDAAIAAKHVGRLMLEGQLDFPSWEWYQMFMGDKVVFYMDIMASVIQVSEECLPGPDDVIFQQAT